MWNLSVTVLPSSTTVDNYLKRALDGRDAGSVLPFVTVFKDTGEVIGSTRFWKVDRLNRNAEDLYQRSERISVSTLPSMDNTADLFRPECLA